MSTTELQRLVADLLPERRGHFAYESGHHGAVWLDLERLFLAPDSVRPFAELLGGRLAGQRPQVVCGPLVEGAFVALAVASALRVPFTYSVPTPRSDTAAGADQLFPIAYPIPEVLHDQLRGQRVAVVNDVINAGSAVRGTLAALEACGAEPVAIATLAVYGGSAAKLAAAHELPLETLASFPAEIWEPADCPLCARGEPLTPGPFAS